MTYTPANPFPLFGWDWMFYMSDGTSWLNGDGSRANVVVTLDHVEVTDTTFRYLLNPPSNGVLYFQTDLDAYVHASQGTLGVAGPLVIEARPGSAVAQLHGLGLIVNNDSPPVRPGQQFHSFSSIVGSVIPFTITYTLPYGTWALDTFDQGFSCTVVGSMDFKNPVSTPALASLTVRGSRRISDATTVPYLAIATYENGIQKDVSIAASWSVSPPGAATVDHGVLAVPPLIVSEQPLTLDATYAEGGATLEVTRDIVSIAGLTHQPPAGWATYQGDHRHTGYIPITLDPGGITVRWLRTLSNQLGLNPIAASDGALVVSLATYASDTPSLFALDPEDGHTIWSRNFGPAFSVNPPSLAYGNIYLQTCNSEFDTWLWALDSTTGNIVFQSPFDAQWEKYLAPTIYEGSVYVDGGTYGGMYGFDAFSGARSWFQGSLAQKDQWTPAVDGDRAYAYVGPLTAIDRATGNVAFTIPDPSFVHYVSDMNCAPILGTHADVIGINVLLPSASRLVSFDVAARTMRWQITGAFTGQPVVAHDAIYVINGNRLSVIDELTGTEQWSWPAPANEALGGTVLVTDSHVFVCSDVGTYAIDLGSHSTAWSYPAFGQLAFADGTLYLASRYGWLQAFNTTDLVTPTVVKIFDAQPAEGGVRVRWEFSDAALGARAMLQRAPEASGPWVQVGGERSSTEEFALLDRDVEPGRRYWYRLETQSATGTVQTFGPISVMSGIVSGKTRLGRIWPNPIGASARIECVVPRSERIRLAIYDLAGREVAALADAALQPGVHAWTWTPDRRIPNGLYFARVQAAGERADARIALAR